MIEWGCLVETARSVPKESRQTCSVCGQKSPLFFGDPAGEYWCAVCQVLREHPELTVGPAVTRPSREVS